MIEKIETGLESPRQGVFVAIINDEEKLTLMQMRSDGAIGFPGGNVDEGETLGEALQREVLEECGYNLNSITRKPELFCSHRFPIGDDEYFHTHLFLLRADTNIMKQLMLSTINDGEHFIIENMGNFMVSLKEEDNVNEFINNFLPNTVKEELQELLLLLD